MFKFKLIDEARSAYKFSSIIITAFLTAMALLQANFGLVTLFVPAQYLPWLVAIIGVAAIIARLLKQEGPSIEGKYKKYVAILDQMAKIISTLRGNPDMAEPVQKELVEKLEEKAVQKDLIAAKISIESKQTVELPIAPQFHAPS